MIFKDTKAECMKNKTILAAHKRTLARVKGKTLLNFPTVSRDYHLLKYSITTMQIPKLISTTIIVL